MLFEKYNQHISQKRDKIILNEINENTKFIQKLKKFNE